MDLSFIILAWNSEAYVERCLTGIRNALSNTDLDYEIRILDNGSRDDTSKVLAAFAQRDPEHVFPVYESHNLGTTKSRNVLCRAARGDYLCVMDSDVELPGGVVEELIRLLRADPKLGVVVPRITYPSGAWQKSFDRFPTLWDKINRFVRLRGIEHKQGEQMRSVTSSFYVDYAISAFWLMPKRILDHVGLLDEKIFYAPEDVDFCLRVWQAGYRILYSPAVSVVHHTQEISRGFKLNKAKINHVKGLVYYFIKHRYFLRRPTFASAID
jgi:GT2 family glycosyltransferase